MKFRAPASIALILFASAIALAQQRPQSPPPRQAETQQLTPLSQLVELTARDGVLELNWADGVPHQARRISAQGPEWRWLVEPSRRGGVQIERAGIGARRPDQFVQLGASSGGGVVGLGGTRRVQLAFVDLVQGPGRQLRLLVMSATVGSKRFVAADLLALRTQEPAVVREYLLPMLEQITGEPDILLPGGTDAYRAFDEITPDEQTEAKVSKLVPQLSAPAVVDRQRASDELESLCPRAICSLLRIDLSQQTPEALQRIHLLLQRNQRRSVEDPSKLREDLPFLIDCLEFSDFRVRAAARARIEQIRGAAIDLPPAPRPDDWSRAADELRLTLALRQRT